MLRPIRLLHIEARSVNTRGRARSGRPRGSPLLGGLLILSLFLSACRELALQPETPVAGETASPDAAPSRTRVLDPTLTPPPLPTPTPTPTPADIWIDPSGVRVYPAGGLYSGDTLSFEIEAHNGGDDDRSNVPVVVDWEAGSADSRIDLPRGGSGSTDLLWVWDTGSLVRTQMITVTIDPDNETGDPDPGNNVAVIHVDLAPGLPANEVGAEWQTVPRDCCPFRFISGTAAARDIAAIARIADEALAFVEDRLDVRRRDRLEGYLIDRGLGHGGVAGDGKNISSL